MLGRGVPGFRKSSGESSFCGPESLPLNCFVDAGTDTLFGATRSCRLALRPIDRRRRGCAALPDVEVVGVRGLRRFVGNIRNSKRSPRPTARRQASEVMGTAGWRLQQLSRRLTLLGNFLCWGTLSRMKLYVLPERGLTCSQRLPGSPLLCAAVLCKRITHL